ncbi:hypothetical protein BHE74_00055898 [Ensete ventricosum]|nr:hypothetical protein GW17_00060338 [Ensete ventricosum]RWW38831.1 hypothetical protein BHE74_00055898 [Ensete ventricosum]RZS26997.1 hypothetical protein BHM03_00060424 [Ensete ventricosum]
MRHEGQGSLPDQLCRGLLAPLLSSEPPHQKNSHAMSFANDRPKGYVGIANELWSREHHCKKGWLLMIEPVEDEDSEPSEEGPKTEEEAMEEEPQPADYAVHALAGYTNPQTMKVGGLLKQQSITVLIDMCSTNNFLDSKFAAHLVLQIEGCNKFNVKVADGRILNCDQRCPQVKLLLQDQEVVTDFFLLPIDDYEAVLRIKWLTMLGDIS